MSEAPNKMTGSRESPGLLASELCSLFEADRRQLVLDILGGQTTVVDLDEIAAEIAERESGFADEETIERVATTLHHTHLPKLAEVGLLDYDPESHRIDSDGGAIPLRDGPTKLSKDELVAFADQHRRRVLRYLSQTERTTLEKLSVELADEDARMGAEPSIIAMRLHHYHLPQLDEAGFVHYDPDEHIVEAAKWLDDM